MSNIKFILTRPIVLYLIFIIAIWYIPWFYAARAHAIAQVLTRFKPRINYFEDFANPREGFAINQLNACVNYHKTVGQVIPLEGSEAYQMAGYCYGLLGDWARAEKYYQMSIKIMPGPYYFWPYYNLGILEFKKGDYSKAVDNLQEALGRDEAGNHWLWRHSRVFDDVRLSDPQKSGDHFTDDFRESRKQAYFLLMESMVRLKSYNELLKAISAGLKDKLGGDDIFYYYGGVGEFYRGDYKESLIFLHLAVRDNGHNSDAIYYIGEGMQAVGRQDLAEDFFNAAEQIKKKEGPFMEKQLNPSLRFF